TPNPGAFSFQPWSVASWMALGSVVGVLVGGVLYTLFAYQLARRAGRTDVTAMPVGLDTPSTFAVALLILMPTLREAQEGALKMEPDTASIFAWNVAMVVLVLVGLFKIICAPLGNRIREWIPRAGLLGSLSGIALAVIVFLPMWREIAAAPLVGLPALVLVLATFMGPARWPGRFPGAVVAVLIGLILYVGLFHPGHWLHFPFLPPPTF